MVEQTLIEELIGAIKQDPKMRNRTHSAVVARVDDEGVVWVYVAGSNQETPTATTSAEVKRGDGVMVEWRNDRLYIVGNTTDPSAGKARVQAVEDAAAKAGAAASRALTAAASAEESAETAATAAAKAVEDADKAGKAAKEADQKAVAAGTAADNAQKSADIAQESAHNASEYAARALGNLSTVQSVTETLNWITTHGTMTKTDDYAPSTDTEVVEGKKYYSRSGSGTAQDPYVYTLISNPTGDPSASGYYEGVLDPTHVYFVQDNAGDYEVAGVRYAIVTEPKVEDVADYYVLSIDESLNNYVATHLAVTSEGLWIIPDEGGNRVLIATGQGTTYTEAGTYIIKKTDGADLVLAKFLEDKVQIGQDDESHAIINYRSLKMEDETDNIYFDVFDLRDWEVIEGEKVFVASVSDKETITEATRSYETQEPIYTLESAYVDGVEVEVIYLQGSHTILFKNEIPAGSSLIVNYKTESTNLKAFTFGKRSINYPNGRWSFAVGHQVVASGDYSFAEGGNTKATGKATHAEGWSTQANGENAHAEGNQAEANGDWSHAEGVLSVANGMSAHAEGNQTEANGDWSHAEGKGAESNGENSHAEGSFTKAGGRDSHAEGDSSEATGRASHAQNKYTKAPFDNQTAIGKFNSPQQNTAFEIGNGTTESNRSNALTVDWDGNIETAIDTTAAAGTVDGDLYRAITALGWQSEVID